MRDVVLLRIADVNETAGVVEFAERGLQPAEIGLLLEVPWRGKHRWRNPGERGPTIFRRSDVHPALERNLELESGPGPELEKAHAPRRAVVGLQQLDAANLRKVSDATHQFASTEIAAEKARHGCAF